MAVELEKLGIAGYRQFRGIFFDLTDPESGRPLEKVCFIGGNGTGKSSLLKLILKVLEPKTKLPAVSSTGVVLPFLVFRDRKWSEMFSVRDGAIRAYSDEPSDVLWERVQNIHGGLGANILPKFGGDGKSIAGRTNLLSVRYAYCPPDSEQGIPQTHFSDVPQTNLDEALKRLAVPVNRQVVGQGTVKSFWVDLIAAIKSREAGLLAYQKLEENKERTIREVEAEFVRGNPDILKELSDFWNVVLSKASLEFDYEHASIPIQLTDNLKAYVRLKDSKERIPYAELSTGIRNFIFKLGHIFTIFRGKPENRGILLVDEPENSLHPDFLFDLVDHYRRAAPGAQLFMATHSPIVAAQFSPEERFILEFDETGGVSVRRGVTPEGDDPNDVLLRDFAVRSLYGAKGLEKWKRFRELDHLIQEESDPVQRRALLKEYMDLGKAYNFSPDEVSR